MEIAYQKISSGMNNEIIQYTLSLIQNGEFQVDNLRDFMKGYFVSKFVWILNTIHVSNGNPPNDDEIIFQEYLRKINNSEKLKKLR